MVVRSFDITNTLNATSTSTYPNSVEKHKRKSMKTNCYIYYRYNTHTECSALNLEAKQFSGVIVKEFSPKILQLYII